MIIQADPFLIRPVSQNDLGAILEVYRQCEDFLALGPVATASMQMVLKDIEISTGENGIFCSILRANGNIIGVVDYIPNNYQGDPRAAYLSLLMLAAPYRNQGFGKIVLEAIEREVKKAARVSVMFLGVQVNNPQALLFWKRRGYRIVGGPKLMPDQTTVFEMRKDFSNDLSQQE
jgi:ribosomal protein S18 acetylase RimI-like enzyme